MERPSSAAPVTPDSGVGGAPHSPGCAKRLERRDCCMPGGRPPYTYYVDTDTGVSYWELPAPPAGAAKPADAVIGSTTGAGGGVVAKPSVAGMWSPRGIVAAGGEMSPLPLQPKRGPVPTAEAEESKEATVEAPGSSEKQ